MKVCMLEHRAPITGPSLLQTDTVELLGKQISLVVAPKGVVAYNKNASSECLLFWRFWRNTRTRTKNRLPRIFGAPHA